MNNIFERSCAAAILLKIDAIYSLWLSLKIDKVAITHLAMEIHIRTTDHVVAVEKVAEQHIGTKYSKCNSLRVLSHIIILSKSATTLSKVGQGSTIPLAQDTVVPSYGSKICSKLLYLLQFARYL